MRASSTDTATAGFTCATGDALTRDHLIDLFDGRIGALRLPHFFASGHCANLTNAVKLLPFGTYNATRVFPPIIRFGPSLNDSRQDGALSDDYWKQAEKTRQNWPDLASCPDPLLTCRKRFAEVWGEPVELATIGGRPVHAGVLREINGGALVHYDDVNLEFPGGLFDTRVVGQLAFNVYISTTDVGGQTVIWDRVWQPQDERFRRGYGYDQAVTADTPSLTVAPAAGDALLFNAHNLHAVRPTEGGSRIAFAFFIGLTDSGQLVVWS